MFTLIAIGWAAYRFKLVGESSVKGITNLLLFFVAPAVTIHAFQRPFDLGQLGHLGIAAVVDTGAFILTILIAKFVFLPRFVQDKDKRVSLKFGTVYTNAGFLGIPLTFALLGDEGVLYAVVYIAVFTVFVWTHGLSLFEDDGLTVLQKVKQAVLNPGIVGIVVALALYSLSLTLPTPISEAVDYLASMNTPLSMIVIGLSLASFSLRTVFSDGLVWFGTLMRNLVVPLLFVIVLWFIPIGHVAKLAILISVSTPVAATLVMFTVRSDRDSVFPTRLLCLSTLLSIVTLPAVLTLASVLW